MYHNRSLNLSILADKLINHKWLLTPSAHKALCQQVESFLNSPSLPPFGEDDAIDPRSVSVSDELSVETDLTALIHVQGVLAKNVSELEEMLFGMLDVDWVSNALDNAVADENVKNICLIFASPGGETTGIEELGRKIAEVNSTAKPVFGFTDERSTSAAYWLMSQCRELGMTPSAAVGGIGVYTLVEDASKMLEKEGLNIQAISSGRYKLMGHSFRPLTAEEKKILEDDVNKQHMKFISTVTTARPQIEFDDCEGLVFEGEDSYKKGFVDHVIDSLDEYLSTVANNQTNNNMKKTEKVKVPAKEQPKVELQSPEKEIKAEEQAITKAAEDLLTTKKAEEAVPGVPGTESEEEGGYDDGYAECAHCKGKGKVKKAEEEDDHDGDDDDDDDAHHDVKKAGDYDGGYAEEEEEEKMNASTPQLKKKLWLPTQDEWLEACGVTAPKKELNPFQEACKQAFTGTFFKN